MDALMLDGNSVAGLLQEVFSAEMTSTIGTCGNCGSASPVGTDHVFRGAGVVLRCPACDNPLVKIVRTDARIWIGLPGVRVLEVAV